MSSQDGSNLGRGVLDYRQPPVPAARVAAAAGNLKLYRFMAFLTGVVLVSACISWIVSVAVGHHHNVVNAALWIGHGWCYFIYVIVTVALGFKLRWPLARYVLVMLAGTIPTMSFVAEHFVTQAVREQTVAEPAGTGS
jgi:integral membrane protein